MFVLLKETMEGIEQPCKSFFKNVPENFPVTAYTTPKPKYKEGD
jgi:hypothetical protein